MFMEDEEKDKEEGEGALSEDAIGEVLDEDAEEEGDPLMETGEDDEYKERDWA
jgi:hypothetical protein